MYFIALYACVIWFVVYTFRRRWPAFVVLLLSIPLAAAVIQMCGMLFRPNNGLFIVMATAFEVVILCLGAFIALQPRAKQASKPCFRCRYDLAGNETGICPECGRVHDAAAAARWRFPPPAVPAA